MYRNRNISKVKYIKRKTCENAKKIKKETTWNTENCNHPRKSSIKKEKMKIKYK
jgi:hypothetical protein